MECILSSFLYITLFLGELVDMADAKDKIQVNLIINNRAGGNASIITQMIANKLHSQQQQRLF